MDFYTTLLANLTPLGYSNPPTEVSLPWTDYVHRQKMVNEYVFIDCIYLDMHLYGVAELIAVKKLKVKFHVFLCCLFACSVRSYCWNK